MSWPVPPHGFLGSQASTAATDNDTYQISKSLRFNSADSTYLSRTPSVAGNRKTWTWSGWVKKANSGVAAFICADPNSGSRATSFYTRSLTDGRLEFEHFDGTTTYNLTAADLLRDPSSYYHLVVAVDTTQATNTNRTKIYKNGALLALSGTYVPQNTDMDINNNVRHNLGRFQSASVGVASYLDGYLAEINFIDGQALTPSSFGETDATTGRWKAKAFSGNYGTNGFYLPFSNQGTTQNLFTYSEDFSNAAWTKFQSTVSVNAAVAPNGTTTADKLIEAASVGDHQLNRAYTAVDNTTYTLSAYAKAGERTVFRLYLQNKAGTYNYSDFDLVTGTIPILSGVVPAITAVGNGWYRCSVTANAGTGATASPLAFLSYGTGTAGSGTNGLFVWGAQIEAGSSAGPYMYTGASAQASTLAIGADASVATGGYNNWIANNLSVTPGVGNDSLTDSPSNYGTISTTLVNDTYQISKSLRFNSADIAHLVRTPLSASNQKTYTFNFWVKRSGLGASSQVFMARFSQTAQRYAYIGFESDDTLTAFSGVYSTGASTTTSYNYRTTQVFRDTSAWYMITVAVDTTSATASERVKLYVNGTQITSFSTATQPALNQDGYWNSAQLHAIGTFTGTVGMFSGYMAEVNVIDGQALTPDSFGTRDINTYLWKPKAYTGTYGTNGFYLNFSDSSNTTATTLGKDQAGSNNWTPNNFSVSAGPGNDSLVDSPTYYGTDTGVGGEVRGNYCTLNPLSTTSGAFVQGNLRYTGPSDWRRANGTMAVSSGKWYYEVTLGNSPFGSGASDSWNAFGFGLATGFASTTTPSAVSDAVILSDAQHYKNFSGSYTSLGTSFSSGDVLSVAVDLGANTFKFYRNNSQLVTGTIGGTAGRELVPVIISYNGSYGVMDVNFGQRPFIHAAPSGFRALRDYNKLPTPTGGEVRGNYATLNPISTIKGNIIDGNLTTNGGDRGSISTIGMTSGKWYCEMYVTAVGAESSVGISRGLNVMNPYIGSTSDSWGYYFNGLKYNNGSGTSYGSSYTTGDTIGAAFDADVGTIVFYKNGISQGTAYTSLTSGPYYFATSGRSSTSANNVTMNFGQRPWAYDAPFGFLPLCTTLLPQPIVQKSSSYMDVVTYTGNGAASRSITGLGFSPDLVWLKARSLPYVHGLHDTVRGASRFLASNSTASELINEADGSISAFNSDGFTISSGSNSNATFNTNTSTYVAWAWDESPIAGMDIVGYTGTGSNMTISHSLGVTPKMIINKLRSGTGGWPVYHASLGNTGAVQLESTGAFNVSSTYWNNTSPTSSNFTVAAGLAVNGATYINYVFAEVEGFSKFGSYTGNGSADGPFVWCGFRPRWVLFKESSASGNNWNIYDTARDVSNPEALQLKASAADAEGSNTFADYTSNGFKVRVSTAGINSSGQTYIFAAFAESPFKYARAR